MKSPLHLYREAGLISAIDQHIAERLGELAFGQAASLQDHRYMGEP